MKVMKTFVVELSGGLVAKIGAYQAPIIGQEVITTHFNASGDAIYTRGTVASIIK